MIAPHREQRREVKKFLEWVRELPEAIFAVILLAPILLALYYADKSTFVQNQFPGLILDILVFGVLIVVFNKVAERRRDIKRWKEEIDDFRGWNEKEATFRIVGNIKRLNKHFISDIDLSSCFLESAFLNELNLEGANLKDANLQNARLVKANLKRASLFRASLQGAWLVNADLSEADLSRSNLKEALLGAANLQSADLQRAHCERAEFDDAKLQGANLSRAYLQEAQGLTFEQLNQVKTLYKASLDRELEIEMQEKSPRLFENPCGGNAPHKG